MRLEDFRLEDFVRESNHIEGIHRPPTGREIDATRTFLLLDTPTIAGLETLVAVYAPNKPLRRFPGMDVRVGNHIAPPGGPEIVRTLGDLLADISDHQIGVWHAHLAYENLHPFMDGNGRSGRALWAWMMNRDRGGFPLGFLHHFYYQTLEHQASRKSSEAA